MRVSEIWQYSASGLHAEFVDGALRAQDIVGAHLERIDAVDSQIGAFLYVDREGAMKTARMQDDWSKADRIHHPLSGVPVALKDNLMTHTMPTTAGSKILAKFIAPYDATVVERLGAAGAIMVGKTNLDEFAMGSSTEHSAWQKTRNPWDLTRVPGGSSGGSAAAVASQMVPLALGSDTGGSIRQPAAYCGIVGMKPTYGRVSRYGLIAFASSLDQIGPLTRTVKDAELLYRIIQGHDPRDSTSLPDTADPFPMVGRPLRIGIPREYFTDGIAPGVRTSVEDALERLKMLGHQLVDISLPHTEYAIATYYLIAPAEASSNLARYDGVRYGLRQAGTDLLTMYETTRDQGFGDEVKRRILLGTHALSAGYYDAYYSTAQKVRTLIRRDFEEAFAEVDYIVTPTTPDQAFVFGERDEDPIRMYLGDIFTVTANLAGIPGLSMPIGVQNGLPVGLQWLAPAMHDLSLLSVARMLEMDPEEWIGPKGVKA